MKIRTGFVTNSSSSSFIVVFDKVPESMEEVKSILFGNSESVGIYDKHMPTIDVATRVYNDIVRQTPNDWAKIGEKLMGGEEISYTMWRGVTHDGGLNNHDEVVGKVQSLAAESYRLKHAGKFIFVFHYSDNDGEEVLEHGGIFAALEHEVISHH